MRIIIKQLVFFLFFFTTIFALKACQYTPAVRATDGVEKIHITQPSLIKGYALNVLNFMDTSPPCRYEILGWEDAKTLYFEQVCYRNKFQLGNVPRELDSREISHQSFYRINIVDNLTQEVDNIPLLYIDNETNILTFIEDEPNNGLHNKLIGSSFASPDQVHIAFISQHIYGPQDILVLKPPLSTH